MWMKRNWNFRELLLFRLFRLITKNIHIVITPPPGLALKASALLVPRTESSPMGLKQTTSCFYEIDPALVISNKPLK